MSYPKSWRINRKAIANFFQGHQLTFPVTYKFFSPLSKARESDQRCRSCGANIINKVKDKGRKILLNRRLLLIKALEIAYVRKGCVDLEKLAEYSLQYPNLFIKISYQKRVLCTVTPVNIALFGAVNEVKAQFCYPVSKFRLEQFDPNNEYLPEIIDILDDVCSNPDVIIKVIK